MRFFLRASLIAPLLLASATARAGDFDLEDDDPKPPPPSPASGAPSPLLPPAPIATIRIHAYTLEECLALADRNVPTLWAAKARLAQAHAQLDEARWLPYWQWGAQGGGGAIPPISGTVFYNTTPQSLRNLSFGESWGPIFQIGLSGVIPLYTFGKITAGLNAAEANVRYSEWDSERVRQQVRMDVRRAFFGLMLARDAKYIANEAMSYLDKGIAGVSQKLDKGDASVEEVDRIRLQMYRDELNANVQEAYRGESYANAALRFLTGVQTAFDIPDEPLRRPTVELGSVVQYLTAARLFRADVNLARSGVMARKHLVDLARARLYPDIGIQTSFGYSIAPGAERQNTAWIGDPVNYFYYGAVLGFRWNLDLLPAAARVRFAEAQLEEARAMERYALGGTAVEVENAYAIALQAKIREETWARAEGRARGWISSTQSAIDLGTKDERHLMEPLRFFINSRVQHETALMDLNVALSELARVSGWDAAAPGSVRPRIPAL